MVEVPDAMPEYYPSLPTRQGRIINHPVRRGGHQPRSGYYGHQERSHPTRGGSTDVQSRESPRCGGYASRRRVGERNGLFADRKLSPDVVELTSRVSTDRVAEAKRRLSMSFLDNDRVDVALATNMISVGLDITRLGLMA